MLECPGSLLTAGCVAVRSLLFKAAGLDPTTGKYSDCARAGRVLVGSVLVPVGVPMALVAKIEVRTRAVSHLSVLLVTLSLCKQAQNALPVAGGLTQVQEYLIASPSKCVTIAVTMHKISRD